MVLPKLFCRHRHDIDTHPACFAQGDVNYSSVKEFEKATGEPWYKYPEYRIGYLDIEVDNLKANFGTLLSWAIKEKDGDTVYAAITKEELFSGELDKRLTASVVEELQKYKIIVTYYGSKMDIPYIRTKALYYGLPFPGYGDIYSWDLYYTVKSKLQLSRNSLAVATEYLGIPGKTPLNAEIWNRAKYGDSQAIDAVVEHNIADVEILEQLHNRLSFTRKWLRTSI